MNFESAWGEPFILLDDIANKYDVSIKNVWCVEFEHEHTISKYPLSKLDRMQIDNTYANSLDQQKLQIEQMFDKNEVEITTGSFDDFFKPLSEEE